MHRSLALLVVLAATLAAAPARAQSPGWHDRGYVGVSGWYQGASASFADVSRPVTFVEPAIVDTTYGPKAAAGFDVGAGVRAWRSLALGIDVSRFSKSSGGSVAAQVPHPFYFNRPRPVSGDASGLTRAETALHAQIAWIAALTAHWQIALMGGPSWFILDQDLVTDVAITQSFPFDAAVFAGATSTRISQSRIGFNAGGDLDYMLRPHVGLGLGVTFSHARVPLTDTLTVDAGGVHVGGGIRFRF